MQKKHIISIAGKPGSGKSTTSKLVAEQLGFTHYSTGDFFREIGRQMGLDVLSTNKAAVDAKDIDQKVDDRQKQLGQTEDKFVIDARLGWYFIPQSFKVYLDLEFDIAAARILKYMETERRANEHIPESVEAYTEELEARYKSETDRYANLYAANPADLGNYDLVVATDSDSLEVVATRIVDAYKRWLN